MQQHMKLWSFAFVVCVAVRPVYAQEPAVVISSRSADELIGDFKYVAEIAGHEKTSDIVVGFLNQLTQGKELSGVDRAKPLGIYMSVSAKGRPENPVLFVPVADQIEFRGLLQVFSPALEDKPDGIVAMHVWSVPVFAKFQGRHCFIARKAEHLAKTADPAKLVNTRYDVAIDVSLDQIPNEAKEAVLARMEQRVQRPAAGGPKPQRDAAQQLRVLAQKVAVTVLQSLVKDSEHTTAGFDVDQKTKRISYDLSLVARSDTDLARELARYGAVSSPFSALADPQAAMSLLVSVPVLTAIQQSADLLALLASVGIETAIADDPRLKTEAARKVARNVANKLLDVIRATAKTGQFDNAFIVNAASAGGVQVVVAGKLANGNQLAALIDELREAAKDDPRIGFFKADIAKHGDARIHAIGVPMDEKAKQGSGDGPIYLAVRDDSVWIAAGRDGLSSLKSAIDTYGKPGAPRPAVSFRATPSKLIDMLGPPANPMIARVKKTLADGGDDVRIEVVPVERGIRLHIETGDAILKCCREPRKQ